VPRIQSRPVRERRPSTWLRDYWGASITGGDAGVEGSHDFVLAVTNTSEPNNFREASMHDGWMNAMQSEIDSINRNGTWQLVDLPVGKRSISARWVYKIKPALDGKPDKLKARLVARGFEQKAGVDFEETFAPVVKWSTVRSLVALAAQSGWKILHLDVKTAFLNRDLREEVFMEQPEGFHVPGQETKVCKLIRALYGLR